MAYEDIVLRTLVRRLETQPRAETAIRLDNTESPATGPSQFASDIAQQQQGGNLPPEGTSRKLARVWRRLQGP
jgi:hypothetical protein